MTIRARRALLLLAGSVLLAAPARAVDNADKWGLWSSGRVQLRGDNIFQRRVYGFDGPTFIGPGPLGPPYCATTPAPPPGGCAPGANDIQRLKNEGANVVQISHPGLYTENPPYQLDTAVQTNLDNLIAQAANAGLKVVISFRTGPGRSEATFNYFPPGYENENVWSSQAAHDAWVAMWTYTANRYRDNPNVVGYDLMVEPNSNHKLYNDFDPAHFYALHGGTLSDWNPLAKDITLGIRTVDTTTPIIMCAMSYGSIFWLNYIVPTGDSKTVYSVHYYEPFNYTNQDPPSTITYPGNFDPDGGGVVTVNKAWIEGEFLPPINDWKAAHPSLPLMVGEFGVVRYAGGADQYMADVTSVFEAANLTHFLWVWGTSWAPSASVDNFDITHGPDPDNHADVPEDTNLLLQAVKRDWSPIFANDFSGSLAAWSSSSVDGGDLAIVGGSPINGGASLRASVDDQNPLYVQDDTPLDENQYRMRFRLNTGDFDGGAAQGHFRTRIFLGFEEAPLRRLFAVVLKYQNGQYSLIGRARRDDNSQADIPAPIPISAGTHEIEIQWVTASGPAGGDGFFGLWVDGNLLGEVDGLQSYVSGLDFVRLGTMNVKAGASGTLWFDDFDSQRTQSIGF